MMNQNTCIFGGEDREFGFYQEKIEPVDVNLRRHLN